MLQVNRKAMIAALEIAAVTADKKSPWPILACVLLRSTLGELNVIASHISQDVSVAVKADGDPIDLCVDASTMLDRCRSLEGEKLSVKPLDGVVELRADGKRKFTVQTRPGENFPAVETAPTGAWGKIGSAEFAAVIAKTAHAVCDDYTRPALNSLFLEQVGGMFRCVSTNGHAMALAETEAEVLDGSLMLPLRSINAIKRMITGDEVAITKQNNRLFVRCGTSTFSCNTVDGDFVPYEQVMPKGGNTLTVAAQAFASAVKALSGAADAGLLLEFGKKSLKLSSAGAEDEIDLSWDGKAKPSVAKVNCHYLLAAIGALSDCGSIAITLQDDTGGAPMKLVAGGSTQLVMPMVRS